MAQKESEQTFLMDQADKRLYLRFPVNFPIDFGQADHFLSSMCCNVSQTGLFIERSKQFARGEKVCLFVNLPSQDDPIKLIGEVMWTASGDWRDLNDQPVYGIGIKFIGGQPDGDQLLKGVLQGRNKDRSILVATEENSLIL